MRAPLFFCLLLVALVPFVFAEGQVILDEIRNVKADSVTFHDPLFTNYGVISTLVTDSFEATRQFALNVGVANTYLTSQQGLTSFSASLGAIIASKNGDVMFQAEKAISLEASVFNFNALDKVSLESRGTMLFDSLYPTHFTSGSIFAQGINSMAFATLGEIDFNAGSDLNLLSQGSLALSAVNFGIEARTGSIHVLGGDELSLVSSQIIIDGTHGIAADAAGSLDFNTIGDFFILAATFDAFVDDNIIFDFNTITTNSQDTTVFASNAIELDSDSTILVSSDYPESIVGIDFSTSLNITAADTIYFETTGESAPVYFLARNQLVYEIADATTFSTLGSVTLGHNKTDSFVINAPTYSLVSDYTNHRSEDEILITARNQLHLDASHIILNGNGVKTVSPTGQINSESRNLYVETTPNSQTGSRISSGGSASFTSSTLYLSGFAVDGNIQTTQTYTVGALTISSNTNFDTTLKATVGDLQFSVEDDIDISSSNFIINANTIDFVVLDYTLTAEYYALRTNTLNIASSNDLSFNSQFNLNIEGDAITFRSTGNSIYDAQGASVIGGEDISFIGGNNLFVSASEFQIDVTALALWEIDGLITLSAFDNAYLKTSEFRLAADSRMDWTIAGNWIGSYGDLTFTSTASLTYDTLDNGDIKVHSGADLTLTSKDDQTIVVSDAIDMFSQEIISFTAFQNTFHSAGPIDIYGSEEFEFHSSRDFAVTGSQVSFTGDIISQHSDQLLQIRSIGSFDTTTGSYHIEANDDTTIAAQNNLSFLTVNNEDENLLEINSPNFNFNADGVLTIESTLNVDLESKDSVISASNGLFNTQVAGDMDFDIGSLAITAIGSASSTSTLETSYIAGHDDYVHFTARDRFLVTSELNSQILFDSETSIDYTAQSNIQALLNLDILLTSFEETSILANGALNADAKEFLYINSNEDLSLNTFNEKNILITVGNEAKYTVGRDFNIISDGLDPLVSLNCSISVTTNEGSAAFNSVAGELELNSWKTFQVRGYDDTSDDDEIAGDFDISSSGTMFWESYESGLLFIVDENDPRGLSVTTERNYDGNQEYLATLASVKYLGYDGFEMTSDDFRVWAQDGITINANDTSEPGTTPAIHFQAGEALTAGARGLTIVAGKQAPIINEDFTLSSGNDLAIESQDLLSFFALSTTSLTAGGGDLQITTQEGNTIEFSSGGNIVSVSRNSHEFTTEDGDQYYNANSKSFTTTAAGSSSIFTNDGPIEMDALGGEFNLIGADLAFDSNMDTIITSLAFIQITAGDSLQLVGQDENNSGVLIKNQRDIDNIYINGNDINAAIDQIQDLTNLQYANLETQVYGNNIDFVSGGSVTFDSQGDSIFIGTDSLPIVKMTASLTGENTNAIEVSAIDRLLLQSANTITSVSDTIEFTSGEFGLFSTGFVYIQTQTGDVNFEAILGDINILSELITTTVTGIHTITAADSITLSSSGADFGDRIEFDVATDITVTSDTALYSTGDLFDLSIGNNFEVTSESFTISNNLGFDPSFVLPYYNFITYERQSITLDFQSTFSSTVTNELSFSVGVDILDNVPLPNAPVLNIETTTYQLDTVNLNFEHLNNGNTNVQFGATNSLDFVIDTDSSISADRDIEIYSIGKASTIATTSASFTSVTDSIFNIGKDATFDFATSYDITTSTGDSQMVEISSLENDLEVASEIFTIAHDGTTSSSYFDVEASDISITALNSITINGNFMDSSIHFFGSLYSDGGDLVINSASSLYNATRSDSDIDFRSNADLSITSATGTFESSQNLEVYSFSGTTISTTVETDIASVGGDINILEDGAGIIFEADTTATFTASGYQPDTHRAITIENLEADITFDATLSVLVESETKQTYYATNVNLVSPLMSFTTSNYESPITLLIDDGTAQITATAATIEGGKSAQFRSAGTLAITNQGQAGGIINLITDFPRNGILFDTDLKQNFHSSAKFSSTASTTVDAADIRFHIDRARGDLGVVQLKSTAAGIALTTTGTDRPISFLSTAGNIEMKSTTTLTTTSDYLEFTAENHVINGPAAGAAVLRHTGDYGQIKSLTGDIYGIGNAWSIVTTTTAGSEITATTDGFGSNNDILITAGAAQTITLSGGTVEIAGNNGDAAVVVENWAPGGSISITSPSPTGLVSVDSLAGIQFVFTGTGPATTGIQILSANDIDVTTWEKRGSIFFQSDVDTIMAADTEIRHTEITARLGFFSVTPEHIHVVGLQSQEGCVESGFCGSLNHVYNLAGLIQNVQNVALDLQIVLRNYGLIDWTHSMR